MIRNRNILKISLLKNLIIKNESMNNLTPVNYDKIKKTEKNIYTKENGFINFGHTINLKKIPKSNTYKESFNSKKICIIFHIYYDDLLNEILNRLKSLKFSFDLIIVSPEGSPFNNSNSNLFSEFNTHFLISPNVGKDIGGKLTAFKYILENDLSYDYLILAHDKKSTHTNTEVSKKWRNDLYNAIFSEENVNHIMNGFMHSDKIKLCGGRVREGLTDSRAIAVHRGNTEYIKKISETIFKIKHQENTAFVGGTMFWVDWNYFKEIFKNIDIDSIIKLLEFENVQEPSYSHGMERIFGILVTYKDNKIGSI
jgi:lipopolysaccharide biosynthesis protein